MRIVLVGLILIGSILQTRAQDLDYPDFRSKKDNFSKIRETDIRNDVACFAMAALDESIGKGALPTIPIKDYGSNYMTFEGTNASGETIQVIVKTTSFNIAKHKMFFSEKHLLRIDNHPYYGGVYGQPPHTAIESVTVVIGKDTVALPPAAYNDLYDPKFSFNEGGSTRTKNAVYLSNDKHTFYIYMLNIDNRGAEYTWVIRDKQYIRRVVDFEFLQ